MVKKKSGKKAASKGPRGAGTPNGQGSADGASIVGQAGTASPDTDGQDARNSHDTAAVAETNNGKETGGKDSDDENAPETTSSGTDQSNYAIIEDVPQEAAPSKGTEEVFREREAVSVGQHETLEDRQHQEQGAAKSGSDGGTAVSDASLDVGSDRSQDDPAKVTPDADTATVEEPQSTATAPKNSGIDSTVAEFQAQILALEQERDEIQDQYDDLREKVSQIKTSLGQRLKTDAAELARIKEEKSASDLEVKRLERQLAELKNESEARNIQQQSEILELKEQAEQKASLDIALSEERTLKGLLESRVTELQEEVNTQSGYAEHYKATAKASERKFATLAQDSETKQRQMETAQAELVKEVSVLRHQVEEKTEVLTEKEQEIRRVMERASDTEGLQAQVKEKNLLIGKLRHEAVILNEHLTNALRMVKRNSEGDTVDKELVSNLIIQFATLPRGDTKKFEVLKLISGFLGWDDERQTQAGLIRGTSSAGAKGDSESAGGFFGRFAEFLERESNRK